MYCVYPTKESCVGQVCAYRTGAVYPIRVHHAYKAHINIVSTCAIIAIHIVDIKCKKHSTE